MSGRGRAPARTAGKGGCGKGGGGKAPRKKAEPAPLVCQVDGCGASLSGCRAYCLRYRVCEAHLAADTVQLGGADRRFCQQCGRFQALEDFDGPKRSCRVRLAHHNTIRQQRRRAAAAAAQPDASLSRSSRPSAARQPGIFERLLNPAEPASPSADMAASEEPDKPGGGDNDEGAAHSPGHVQADAQPHSLVLMPAAAGGGTVPPLWCPPQQPPQQQPVSGVWQRIQVLSANTAQAASEAAAEAAAAVAAPIAGDASWPATAAASGVHSLHLPPSQRLHLAPVVGCPHSLPPGSQASSHSSPESSRTAVWGGAGSVSSGTLLLSGYSHPPAASPYHHGQQQQQQAAYYNSHPAGLPHCRTTPGMAGGSPAPSPLPAAGWCAVSPPAAAAPAPVGGFGSSSHWQQQQQQDESGVAGPFRGAASLSEAVRALAHRRAEVLSQQQHYPPPDYGLARAGAHAAAAEDALRRVTTGTGSARGSHSSVLSHSMAAPAVGSTIVMGRAATVPDGRWLEEQDTSLTRFVSLPVGGLQPAAAYGGDCVVQGSSWRSDPGCWPGIDCSTAAAGAAAAAAPHSPLLPARRAAGEMRAPVFYSPPPPAAASGMQQLQRSSSVPAQYLMGLSEAAAAVLRDGSTSSPGQHMQLQLQSPPGAAGLSASSADCWSLPQQLRSPLMSAGSEAGASHAASAGAALEAAGAPPPGAGAAGEQDGLTAAACLADIDIDSGSNEASPEEDVHSLMAWAAGGAGMDE